MIKIVLLTLLFTGLFASNEVSIKDFKQAVSISYGTGEDIYVVIDPKCRHCKNLLNSGITDDYRVNIIFLPLKNHPESKIVISWILKDKIEANRVGRFVLYLGGEHMDYDKYNAEISLKSSQSKSVFQYPKEIREELVPAERLLRRLDVTRTPTIYNKDGIEISQLDI